MAARRSRRRPPSAAGVFDLGSFVGLGLLLLVAAAVWQRMRPRPLPDLRDVPPAVR